MRIKRSSGVLVSILMVAACNKGGDKSESKGEPQPEPVQCDTASGKIVVGNQCQDDPNKVKDGDANLLGGTLDVAMVSAGKVALTTALVGQADETQLESLQYRFQTIQICRTMETNGSAYNNPQDCLTIFSEDEAKKSDYGALAPENRSAKKDGVDVWKSEEEFNAAVAEYKEAVLKRAAEALADTSNYIDLMSKTDVAKLSAKLQLTGKDAHEYSYGLVNWYRPIKVKASIPLIGASPAKTVYTKAGSADVEVGGVDSFPKLVTRAENMTTAPSELAVFEHANGGSWFKFSKPFVITEDDIKAKKNFKLKLTFNPDGIAKAFENVTSGSIGDTTNNVSISVPMLHLTPIAHAEDQIVQKETYLVTRDVSGAEPFKARVEIYSLKGDATKTVYGVETQTLFTEDSTDGTGVMEFPQAFFVKQGESAVELQSHDEVPYLNLPRLNVGDAPTTAKIISTCAKGTDGMFHPGFHLPEFATCDSEYAEETDVTVTLDGITELK